jgi:cell division septal protein FtsQ
MSNEIYKILKEEREISERSYAVKLVERIVFAFVGMVLVAVIGALLFMVIK